MMSHFVTNIEIMIELEIKVKKEGYQRMEMILV